jgi:hypothetical protein
MEDRTQKIYMDEMSQQKMYKILVFKNLKKNWIAVATQSGKIWRQ